MRFPTVRSLVFGACVAAGLSTTGCGMAETSATAYLTWQIVDANAGNPNTAPALTCDQKAVHTIRVALIPASTNSMIDFPCSSMAGETLTVKAGTYSVQTLALDANYQVLAQLTFEERLFGRTNLGHIIFQIR